MAKTVNPYTRLKERFTEYVNNCVVRGKRQMWTYPKDRLNDGWNLASLHERCAAAEQLGYDVQIRATNDGLVVEYVRKLPQRPYDI